MWRLTLLGTGDQFSKQGADSDLKFNSFVDVLQHWSNVDPEGVAFYGLADLQRPHAQYTYRHADCRARSLAARFQEIGASGQRALLVLENDPDYLLAFLACNYADLVGVPLNVPTHHKHAERLALVARDCGAGFLITNRAIADRHRSALEAAGCPDLVWVVVEDALDQPASSWKPHTPRWDEPAYLQYTSGSTGTPRGVIITHGNLIYQGAYLQRLFSFTRKDHGLNWLPLFHDMGLILGALQPLYTGFPVALARPIALAKNPERWLRAISDLRITFSGGPNFLYDLCVDSVEVEAIPNLDLSCLEVALNAAEPVRARTIQRFSDRYAPYGFRKTAMNPGYGLAEATLALTAKPRGESVVTRTVCADSLTRGEVSESSGAEASRELVSSGRFLPDTDVKIVDPESFCELPIGRVGEIWATGSGIPNGYWRQEALSEAVFSASISGGEGTYMRTGDLGALDEAGNLFITGRLKDVLIFAGKNHYPQDIEETVEATDAVLRPAFSAAISLHDDDIEKLIVLAEVRNDRRAAFKPAHVAARVRAQVASIHGVTVARVVLLKQGQLPKTTSGKIQRRLCREMLLAGTLQSYDEPAAPEPSPS